MTQVTPSPVHPAAEADEVGRRAAPPTPSRGGWSIGIFIVMLALVVVGAIVGFGGTKDQSSPTADTMAVTEASASPDQCAQERQMIAVAFEAYYAENGAYAESFDVLVGSYLREAPVRWTYTPGEPGSITGTGGCAGLGPFDLWQGG